MSYHRWKLNSSEDERRRPYGYESGRYESYRPPDSRSPPRDYSRDTERNHDMESGRRDPRDTRDARAPPRSPRGSRRDVEPPKNLQIDTRVADGSRRTSLSSHSSTSAFTGPPTEPVAAERTAKSSSQPSSAATPTIPKARDPKLQDVFEAIYKWNETLQERMLLKSRKSQLSREDQRRRNEITKIANKVDDYASLSEFQRRFEESGKAESENLSKRLAGLDRQYLEDLEKVVGSISSHTSTSSQAAAQSESLSALESKFAEFQKQNSEQQKQVSEQQKQISEAQEQIRGLLNDRETTTKAYGVLEKDFRNLKSNYSTLQSENSELKRRVADLESTKSTIDDLSRLSQDLHSITTSVGNVESQMHSLVEDLDMKTYNEILDTWIGHDFKNMVISNKKTVAALRQDLQFFQQSTTSQLNTSNALIQEIRKTLERLENSQSAPQQTNTQSPINAQQSQQALQALVEEKFNSFNEVVQRTVADSGDVCADMVDEVRARVDNIEAAISALQKQAEARSKETDVPTRVDLEKFATKHNAEFQLLEKRVESLEGQRLGPRIDSVDVGLANLEKRVQHYQERGVGANAAATEAFIKSIRPEIEDARKRLDALDMGMRSLNDQWANLSTKQMAERIYQLVDPYGQRNEIRFEAIEKDVEQLRSKLLVVEDGLMALISENKKFTDFARVASLDGKRQASPGSMAEEPTKKRKLGPNGQAQLPVLRSSSLNL
ncbi:hypothetical protein F5Y13DRAFT_200704 [Hypoxylon sp. FL1857]|nr:hypothetical protein F5Y13DRAFT_200704 [Hypoxylon sp. FL1857]